MTRQSTQPVGAGSKEKARQAGAKVPDKPRDCAPNVDTWPILDEQAVDAPKARPGGKDKSRS